MKIYEMKEERTMEPETFAHLVSSTLYERRFGPYFVEPVIAGISSNGDPFIAGADLIGCLNFAKDVVVAGTASDKLYGMAEGLWEPDMVSSGMARSGEICAILVELTFLFSSPDRMRTNYSSASPNHCWELWSGML
jgi:20S proteasome alpha/beta subunit